MNSLTTFSDLQVRRALLEGLVALRKAQPTRTAFEYKEVIGRVATALLPGAAATQLVANWDQLRNTPHSLPGSVDEHPDNRKLLAAVWSLIGDGYMYPRFVDQQAAGTYAVHLLRLVVTEKLDRVGSQGEAHPLHPGFLARFRARAPSATDEVVAYLEDAVSCAEARLFRPSLAMVGVANEQTIRTTHAALVHLTLLAAPPANAGARNLLSEVQGSIGAWQVPGVDARQTKEDRHRLSFAATFSEALRVERNNVAHPGVSLGDEVMVEQMLSGFAHHATAFWEVMVKHAASQGFQL